MTRLNGFLDSFVDQAGYRQHAGIWSGIARTDTFIGSSGQITVSGYQNVNIQAFGGSGQIKYVFGPYEGWVAKYLGAIGGPTSDGFFPIALSGIFGFDDAYHAGTSVNINANFGDLEFLTVFKKVLFTTGSRAPLRLSGILIAPVTTGNVNNEQGDINPCLHTVLKPVAKFIGSTMNSYVDPADQDEMRARAMGIGTLFFNTGSGITNLSIGSGIGQWSFTTYAGGDTFPLSATKETFTRLPISTEVVGDLNYAYASTPTGIAIFSPGLYRCSYNCSFRRIIINANVRTVGVRAVLKQQGANPATPLISASDTIPQSHSYGTCSNANTPCCSTSAAFYFNADAGDLVALEGALIDASATTDGVNLTTSGSLILLEKIGPKRGRFGN